MIYKNVGGIVWMFHPVCKGCFLTKKASCKWPIPLLRGRKWSSFCGGLLSWFWVLEGATSGNLQNWI